MFTETPFVKRKQMFERIARGVFVAMTSAIILPLIFVILYLLIKAFPILSLDFLITNPVRGKRAGGIWSPFLGTIYLVVISLMISTPIGVLAGIYLNEYAKDNWLTRGINLAVVNLAGVPSIVHALFGLGAFVLFARLGRSILAASLTLAIMTLPVIIASTKEALASVPMQFREACWNVGATRWQTIRHIVLPNSISGILTGVILQVSRAAGETAPIMFTGAAYYLPYLPRHLNDQFMELGYHIYVMTTQSPDVEATKPLLYSTVLVLLLLTFSLNFVSVLIRSRIRRRLRAT